MNYQDSYTVYLVVFANGKCAHVRSRSPRRAVDHARTLAPSYQATAIYKLSSEGPELMEGVL